MPDRLGMRLSRRTMVAGLLAGSLAACTPGQQPARSPSPSATTPSPDERLRSELLAAEQHLLALYAATAAAHPTLAGRLRPFEDRHRRHLAAVEGSGPVASPRASTSAPATAASPVPGTESPAGSALPAAVPADAGAAISALRSAERTAAAARLRDCLRCDDDMLAGLVAAVAACEAAHGSLLAAA